MPIKTLNLASGEGPADWSPSGIIEEMKVVNKDQAEGKASEVKGTIREAVGKATDNKELQAKGKGDKMKGKGQQLVGGLKDAATKAKKAVGR